MHLSSYGGVGPSTTTSYHFAQLTQFNIGDSAVDTNFNGTHTYYNTFLPSTIYIIYSGSYLGVRAGATYNYTIYYVSI